MPIPGEGFEYPPVKVAWTKREAILFALSIGADETELNLVYVCHVLRFLQMGILYLTVLPGASPRICHFSHISICSTYVRINPGLPELFVLSTSGQSSKVLPRT